MNASFMEGEKKERKEISFQQCGLILRCRKQFICVNLLMFDPMYVVLAWMNDNTFIQR